MTQPDTIGEGAWFCDRGDFWGTIAQLTLCAKCGKSEAKRNDEDRHYSGLFTPRLHMVCDACFDALAALPPNPPASATDAPYPGRGHSTSPRTSSE